MKQTWFLVLVMVTACTGNSTDRSSSTQAADSVVADGIKKLLFPDGKLKAEIPMKDGKRHGLAKEYYKDGKIFQEVSYVNGIKEGLAKQYYEHGIIAQETSYKDGKRHGVQLKYRGNGKLAAEVKYHFDEVCKGLVEYTLKGEKKKKYSAILVKPLNTLLRNNKYTCACQCRTTVMSWSFLLES
jgi:antitoxin component YwqK of YwqJK toxin-antitoxin module